jgi:hypothetical protein
MRTENHTVFVCPSSLPPAATDAHSSTGLAETAQTLLMAAAPEFLGGLGAGLAIVLATTLVRRLRHRPATPHETDGLG